MQSAKWCFARVAAGAALAFSLGCGGDGGGPGGNSFTIQISVNPASLTVQQGTSGTVALTLTRGGGFDGAVSASVSGLPTGVTVSVSPSQLTGATTSAVVTVDVAATVAPGTYTATVTGTATGVGSASTTYQLIVTATPNYSLTATPAALTVSAGASGTSTVNIARTNFTGAVALTLVSPPTGITGTFNPASATGDNSVLTVNVAATVVPGNHTLTISGTATGPGTKTTTLALTVTAAANYSLAVTPSPVTIVRGLSSDLTVTITRTNFTGAVNLALVTPPTGVTGVFNPVSPTGNTSTLTLTVGATAAAGNFTITVMGTATGVPTSVDGASADSAAAAVAPGDRTATFDLVVTLPASIALSANPTALTIPQGGSGSSAITIARTNVTAAVGLTATGQPSGMGVTMSPASTTGTTSTAMVSVNPSTTPGTYPITVTGAATGVANAQTMFSVTVTPVTSNQYEYLFCTAASFPSWFGFRGGSGAWMQVQPTTNAGLQRYTFSTSENLIEVAWAVETQSAVMDDAWRASEHFRLVRMVRGQVDEGLATIASRSGPTRTAARTRAAGGGDWFTTHFRQTAAQTPRPGQVSCPGAPTGTSVTVNALNLAQPEVMRLSITGRGQSQITPPANSTTFTDVQAGVQHLLAFAGTTTQAMSGQVQQVTIPGGPFTVDRATMPAVVNATATLTGLPAGMMVSDNMWFALASGIAGPFQFGSLIPTTSNTRTMFRHSATAAGDYFGFGYSAFQAVGMDNDSRTAVHYFSTFGNQSFAVPPGVPVPTVSQIGTGPDRFRVSGSIPVEYGSGALTLLLTGTTAAIAVGNTFSIFTTPEFRAATGGGSTYQIDTELFSGAGFPTAAHLVAPLVSNSVGMSAGIGNNTPGTSFIFSQRTRLTVQ